ncbi:roadblock/LC7 domain-containing protein [Nocardiopsis oceani]
MVQDEIVRELADLRERVTGVTGGVVAASDGLVVASDSPEVRDQALAALAATTLGLGKRTAGEVDLGPLNEVEIRCQGGHAVVYTVGAEALLAVMGDEGMDGQSLAREARRTIERVGELLEVTGASNPGPP